MSLRGAKRRGNLPVQTNKLLCSIMFISWPIKITPCYTPVWREIWYGAYTSIKTTQTPIASLQNTILTNWYTSNTKWCAVSHWKRKANQKLAEIKKNRIDFWNESLLGGSLRPDPWLKASTGRLPRAKGPRNDRYIDGLSQYWSITNMEVLYGT